MPVLQINSLTKNYGNLKALNNLTLSLEPGNIYGLLGPNGSGKTTTLGIILGILRQSEGDFTWFGDKEGKKYRMKIGAILETPNFYPYMNARQNLSIIQKIKESHDDNITELLELVNLAHREKSKFNEYSLGMKQRLAIAATLIANPDVVIFDEPTNGLDPQGIAEIRNILKRVADGGKTVIMASHLLDEVEKICTHVAIIKDGVLLAQGATGEILTNDITLEISSDDLNQLEQTFSTFSWIKKIEKKQGFLECLMNPDITAQMVNKTAFENGITLTRLVARKRKLEEDFLEITSQTA